MIIDFSRSFSVDSSILIDRKKIEKVDSFKFLGTFFSEDLKWHKNSDKIFKKQKIQKKSKTNWNHRFHAFSLV